MALPAQRTLEARQHNELCTEKHELTSWRSFNSIFRFFGEALEAEEEEEEEEETSNTVTTRSSSLRHKHHDL